MKADALLDSFWQRRLVLLGDRVRQEYGLRTPVFIDLRHKLYDDLDLLDGVGRALHAKIFQLAAGSGRAQQIVGIPDTATPLALAAALRRAQQTSRWPTDSSASSRRPIRGGSRAPARTWGPAIPSGRSRWSMT